MLAAGPALAGSVPASLLPSYLRTTTAAGMPPARLPNEGGATPAGPPITLNGPAGSGVPGPGNTYSNPSAPPPPSDPNTDPNNVLANDPVYRQAKADYQASLDAAGASRDAATNRAMIQFGAVPDFSSIGKSLGLSDAQIAAITGEINPGSGALADQNTQSGNSIIGQLNHAHDQALKQLSASLAARGALESGATGVGVGQQNQTYEQGMSNAYSTLLNNLLGYQDAYSAAAGHARDTLTGSLDSAWQRAVAEAEKNPGSTGSGDGNTSSPPGAPLGASDILSHISSLPAGISLASMLHPTVKKPPLVNPYTTGQKRFG